MFDFGQPLVISGLMLGLASSLHCLGMCSGIATGLSFAAASAPGNCSRHITLTSLLINLGRISAYMIAGAIVGGLGSSVFGMLDHSVAHSMLRWAAAASLGWIGLSMMGLVPLPTLLYRFSGMVSNALTVATNTFRLPSAAGLFVTGYVWGFFPCAMVHAALFYAMLSGSWLNGAAVMIGFGLGTLVPMMAASLGLPLLGQKARSKMLQTTVGLAILLLGVISATVPAASFAEWCKSG